MFNRVRISATQARKRRSDQMSHELAKHVKRFMQITHSTSAYFDFDLNR